jgi:hypothetical protein
MTLNSRGVVFGLDTNQADARYVRRFVGATLTADTIAITTQGGGSDDALINPSGPVIGNIPTDVSSALLAASQGGIFGVQARVLRVGANPSVIAARANGTFQVPTGLLNAQGMGAFEARGFDPDSQNILQGVEMIGVARENWSSAGQGAEWTFNGKAIGATALAPMFTMRTDAGISLLSMRQAEGRILPTTSGNLRNPANTANRLSWDATGLGFFGVAPIARPTITGSRAGNAAVASIAAQLAALGLVIDGTTP